MPLLRAAIACRQVAGVSGAVTVIVEQARRLAARGWEVHVYGEKFDEDRLRAAGAVPERLAGWPWGSWLKRSAFSWLVSRAAARERYDLVWGHGDLLEQDVLSLHNCVHAAHEAVHGVPLPSSSGLGRFHARMLGERRFKLLIANSELMRRDVVSRFGVPAERVQVVHPGYDPARFSAEGKASLRAPSRRELGVEEGELLVGLVTSGDFAKRGVGAFLGALGRLPRDLKRGLKALVVGRESRLGPYRAAARAALGERVLFREPSARVERFYHALDLYVHPALYEEFGMSVLEAMACGTPVLTGRRVGAGELLPWEDLLEDTDEESLARAMERLLSDPALRARRAARGLAACRDRTWDDNFEATWALLEDLSPRGRGSGL